MNTPMPENDSQQENGPHRDDGPQRENGPKGRSLIGLLILILGLTLYAGAVGWLSEILGDMPLLVELLFYIIAGIIWIFPAKRLLKWMAGTPR